MNIYWHRAALSKARGTLVSADRYHYKLSERTHRVVPLDEEAGHPDAEEHLNPLKVVRVELCEQRVREEEEEQGVRGGRVPERRHRGEHEALDLEVHRVPHGIVRRAVLLTLVQ